MNVGYKAAMPSILAIHVIALVLSVALIILSIGALRSFAVALFSSAIVGIFSVALLTRGFLKNLVSLIGDKPAFFTRKKAIEEEAK